MLPPPGTFPGGKYENGRMKDSLQMHLRAKIPLIYLKLQPFGVEPAFPGRRC